MISALTGPGDILPASSANFGDKTALITAPLTLSYTELEDISARVAGGLRDLGVKQGDVVSSAPTVGNGSSRITPYCDLARS